MARKLTDQSVKFSRKKDRDFPKGIHNGPRRWDLLADAVVAGRTVLLDVPDGKTPDEWRGCALAALNYRGIKVTTRIDDEGVWLRRREQK